MTDLYCSYAKKKIIQRQQKNPEKIVPTESYINDVGKMNSGDCVVFAIKAGKE